MKDICQNSVFILLFILIFIILLVCIRRRELEDNKRKNKNNLGNDTKEMFNNLWYQNRNVKDLNNLLAEELVYDSTNLGEYREKISEHIKNKELNRDFNFEVPRFYKTPYQYLDFQDLIIHDSDKIYNTKPDEISNDFKKYKFTTY